MMQAWLYKLLRANTMGSSWHVDVGQQLQHAGATLEGAVRVAARQAAQMSAASRTGKGVGASPSEDVSGLPGAAQRAVVRSTAGLGQMTTPLHELLLCARR